MKFSHCFTSNSLFDLGKPVVLETRFKFSSNRVISALSRRNVRWVGFQRKEDSSWVPEGNFVLCLNVTSLQNCDVSPDLAVQVCCDFCVFASIPGHCHVIRGNFDKIALIDYRDCSTKRCSTTKYLLRLNAWAKRESIKRWRRSIEIPVFLCGWASYKSFL